jgi:predicted nuclease with TOPRIM domain
MAAEIIVGLLSLCGTGMGTLAGIVTSSKLTNYRLEKLEEKVNKHNNVIERVFNLEKENAIQNEKIKELEKKQEEGT